MDVKKFAGTIRKNNRIDKIHSYVVLGIILIYALLGTSNVYENDNSMNLVVKTTSGFMMFQMIVLITIFSIRFLYSYLRVKKVEDVNILKSINLGVDYSYVHEIAKKGAVPNSYFTYLLKRISVFQMVMAGALLISSIFYKDKSGYILVAVAVVVPVLIWLIIKGCFELRVSTRTVFRIPTAPLAVIKFFISVLEIIFTVMFGFIVWVVIYAWASGIVNSDLQSMVAIRSFPGSDRIGLVYFALSIGFGILLYFLGESKRVVKWTVLQVMLLVGIMSVVIYSEKQNNITVTENEIIRTVDGKQTVIKFDEIKDYVTFGGTDYNEEVIVYFKDGSSLEIIGDSNMKSDSFVEKYETGEQFVIYLENKFAEAGIYHKKVLD